MVTPTITFRVPADQQTAVREIVNAVKSDQELGRAVLQMVREQKSRGSANTGMFHDCDQALLFLAGQLQHAHRPEAIFLFGSRARGEARPESDFDLLLVMPDERPLDWFSAAAPIAGSGIAADVTTCRLSNFEAQRTVSGTLAHAADRDGHLLRARIDGPYWERYRMQFGQP